MKHTLNDEILTLFLEGELNSSNAEEVEKEINEIIDNSSFKKIVLDLDLLQYISSAGLRVVLKLQQKYTDIEIINASLEVYDVFEMTGFTSIMKIKKALRKVDISNAEVIGDGYFSTVYRLNKDTIVKVFNRTSDPDQIARELRLAKEAFILGIPTAISFDIVKAGEKLGVIFEMLDCMSLKNALQAYPEKEEQYLKDHAALLKKINTTECFDPNIPDIKEFYFKKLETIKPHLEEKYYLKARKLLEEVADKKTLIHGDCHFKNIMVQHDELLLIDMDTLSVGHPIFEFAAIYAPYRAFNEDDPGNTEKFFGISDQKMKENYDALIINYFGKDDEDIKNKIRLVSYIHMMWWNRVNEPKNNTRLEGCRGRLYQLLDKYDDLDIGL